MPFPFLQKPAPMMRITSARRVKRTVSTPSYLRYGDNAIRRYGRHGVGQPTGIASFARRVPAGTSSGVNGSSRELLSETPVSPLAGSFAKLVGDQRNHRGEAEG